VDENLGSDKCPPGAINGINPLQDACFQHSEHGDSLRVIGQLVTSRVWGESPLIIVQRSPDPPKRDWVVMRDLFFERSLRG
jgi:hypothetical protein